MSFAAQAAVGRGLRSKRRGRRIITLLVLLVILAGALEATDLVGRHYAEDTVATHAIRTTGAGSATASISGWPFLWEVLVSKSLPHVTIEMQQVPIGPLKAQHLEVQLTNVGIDLGAAFSDRTVRVTSVSHAVVTAVVTAAELSQAAGHAIDLPGHGVIRTSVAGHEIAATVRFVSGHVLAVDAGGRAVLRVDLAHSPLIPACNMTLAILAGKVQATCSVSPVPQRLLAAISG